MYVEVEQEIWVSGREAESGWGMVTGKARDVIIDELKSGRR
jgi:hypothetical protein